MPAPRRGRDPRAGAGRRLVTAVSGLDKDEQVGVDSAAAWHADGDGSGVGIKLAVADGGVHQDDVLGVDEPGGPGAGPTWPGRSAN
jgi:hypothetical protein